MEFWRHKDLGLLLCLALVLLVAFSPLQERLDSSLYDALPLQTTNASNQLLLIEIDDKSLQALGRWPWQRSVHARLIEQLTRMEVADIGYNIAFVEPDATPGSSDNLLKQAIALHGQVVLPVFAENGRTIHPFRSATPPEGARLGHVDIELDRDGYVRHAYLKAGINTPQWPAFALSLLADKYDINQLMLGTRNPALYSENGSKWVRNLEVLVPFKHISSPTRYSFIDVLEGNIDPANLAGKTVMVGVSAAGLEPRFLVPSSSTRRLVSGTQIQASLYAALVSGNLLTPIIPIWGVAFALLITISLYAFLFLFRRYQILNWLFLATFVLLLTLPPLAVHFGYWLSVAAAIVGICASLLLFLLYQLGRLNQKRRNDQVTDLANHRMFEETLEIEWEQARIKHTPLTLILLEVDFFRRFTETFGPERGDWVMARLSALLKNHKRKNRDMLARFDEDVFAVLLPITPNNIGISLAEKMRKEVEDLQIEHSGSEAARIITVSIGVSTHNARQDTPSPFQLLSATRTALENAQNEGGNRIVNHNPANTS